MRAYCCGQLLSPSSMGTPKKGDESLDFDCPKCRDHFEVTRTRGSNYERELAEHNEKRTAMGLPPETRQMSQVIW